MRSGSLLLLWCALCIVISVPAFATSLSGTSYLELDYTPLALPANASIVYDVVVNSSAGVFLVLSGGLESGLYRLTPDHAEILEYYPIDVAGFTIYSQLAATDNYVFLASTTRLYRFNISDLHDVKVSPNLNLTEFFNFDIDTLRKLAFAVSIFNSSCVIVDLVTMLPIGSFNYSQGGPFAWFDSQTPGGWAIAVDSSRSTLFIGGSFSFPTPTIVWQYSISNLAQIILMNWVVRAGEGQLVGGFVEAADGKPWFTEELSGWTGAFSATDLNWGKNWTVPTVGSVAQWEYDPETHTGFFFDNSFRGPGPNQEVCIRIQRG